MRCLTYVCRYRHRLATGVPDAAGDVVKSFLVASGKNHASACRREGFGGSGPDPAASARDYGDPTG